MGALTALEVEALREALGQYVENGECNSERSDEEIAVDPVLNAGRRMLDTLNANIASLAEDA